MRLAIDDRTEAVPGTVIASIHRIAREAVTNARRHSVGATNIDIDVRCGDGVVHLLVTNDGGQVSRSPGGFGLRGMAERAAAMGGEFDAGPLPTGGWRVAAHLPVTVALGSRPAVTVPLRVVIADDQEIVRSGIRLILEAHGIDVLGEATDGREAVELARRLRPDVVLVDIRMPRLDGLEVTRMLAGKDVEDPIPVVVVTTFDHDEYVDTAIRNGASGFLLKDAGPALLVEAVRAAAAGDALVSPSITVRFLQHFSERHALRVPRAGDHPHRARGGHRPFRRSRADKRRDRRATVHLAEHREEPRRQHPEQARRAEPRRDRRLGVGDRADGLAARSAQPPAQLRGAACPGEAGLHDLRSLDEATTPGGRRGPERSDGSAAAITQTLAR